MSSVAIDFAETSTPTKQRRERDTSTLAGRLRARRKEIGWTQTHLAEMAGTSQAVIQKIENGKSLRPRILEQLASKLGVSPSWLMFGVEEAGELSGDALELARAWSTLSEQRRVAMRKVIFRMCHGND